MFGNDFPIFLHLYWQFFMISFFFRLFQLSQNWFCVHGLLDYCQLFLGVLCFFGSECVFCIVLVFRSKDGGSLHYLDRYVSDLTMFSAFCE